VSQANCHVEANVIACATRLVHDLNISGKRFVQDVDGTYRIKHLAPAFDGKSFAEEFEAGWAVRPKRGEMYGLRFIGNYRSEIKELFDLGVIDKAKKMGPAKMLEVLRDRFPGRFDLPTENEIRQEISKLMQRAKSDGVAAMNETPIPRVTTGGSADRQRHRHPQSKAFAEFFENLLDTESNIKPNAALEKFTAQFPNANLGDAKVKEKFQNLMETQARWGIGHPNI
jgi:hypothetical protein